MKQYKNYIFDQGNVILDIDPELSLAAFRPLLRDGGGGEPVSAADLLGGPDGSLVAEYQVGGISTAEFVERLMAYMRPGVTESEVLSAWDAIVVSIPERRLAALTELRSRGARTFMLSNTNDEHMRHIIRKCFDGRRGEMLRYFDDLFLSNEMHMAKPDRRIFEEALRRAGIRADETLFIDDLEKNVEAARAVGMDAMLSTGDYWVERVLG